MSDARLSVIVPVHNEADLVLACLESLAPIRARGAEIIVVDGGSSDGTRGRAEASGLADRVLDSPRGRATQMNAGAASARQNLLLFLHVDTRLPSSADRWVSEALATAGGWGRFDVEIDGRHWLLQVVARLMNFRSRVTGIATGDQALFMTRSLFLDSGGFPRQALMEDIAFCRMLKRHSRPHCLRQRVVTSGRRWERHGVMRTIVLMWWLRLAYFAGVSPDKLARSYRRQQCE